MSNLIIAEPPAAYRQRPPLVVDASVLMAAIFAESNREQALNWMRGRALHAPSIVDYEMANAALNKVRRGQVAPEGAAEALAAYAALDIERLPAAPDGVFRLAAQWALSTYDAAYLWLAAELSAPLVTFDARLGNAARAHFEGLGGSAR
jgi:predicted nucleic acid-binding protein